MLNTKKKIIIFNPSIEDGGVEKNLYLLSNYLISKFENIEVISANPEKKHKFNNNIIFTFPRNSFWYKKKRIYKYFICLLILFKRICFNKEKLLIVSFQANIYCLILCKILRTKIIIRSNTSPSGWSKNLIKRLIFSFFLKKADHIIANSKIFKKQLEKEFNINVSTIYNPLNINEIKNLSKKKLRFNFFDKDKNSIKIINIGRLTDQKDQLCLIKAINLIKNIIPLKIIIIGKGKHKSKLRKEINKLKLSKLVKLIGYKKNPFPYFNKSDLFILTSKFEGLPNVLLEAMLLKKFIISSNCPTGPSEILQNGKLGFLFKVSDYTELAKLILKYFNNKAKLNYKIHNGFKSLERFDYEKNCFKYYQIIKKYL